MYSCGYNFRLSWSWKKFLVFVQTLHRKIGRKFHWLPIQCIVTTSNNPVNIGVFHLTPYLSPPDNDEQVESKTLHASSIWGHKTVILWPSLTMGLSVDGSQFVTLKNQTEASHQVYRLYGNDMIHLIVVRNQTDKDRFYLICNLLVFRLIVPGSVLWLIRNWFSGRSIGKIGVVYKAKFNLMMLRAQRTGWNWGLVRRYCGVFGPWRSLMPIRWSGVFFSLPSLNDRQQRALYPLFLVPSLHLIKL
jgi:hypothetical protein